MIGGGQSDIGIYPLFYIYRCAKFGAAVLKASMLDWGVSTCHGYMCIVLYIVLYMVLQRSMLNWIGGVILPWVYVHCAISETFLV